MRKSTENGVDLRILQNKFLANGKTAMDNSELLVLVLGNGRKTVRSRHLGERLWNYCNGDLRNLGQMSMEELLQVDGLGSAGVVAGADFATFLGAGCADSTGAGASNNASSCSGVTRCMRC